MSNKIKKPYYYPAEMSKEDKVQSFRLSIKAFYKVKALMFWIAVCVAVVALAVISIPTAGIASIFEETNNLIKMEKPVDYMAVLYVDAQDLKYEGLNVDIDGDGKADLNIDENDDGVAELNVDTNGDGIADYNVDNDKDGKADVNLDTNGDGAADSEIDANRNGKVDNEEKADKKIKEDLNLDTNGDGIADVNVDTDGDGKADVNLDTNGDGIADVNVDTDGDGKADVNLDTDGDGKINNYVDITGDGVADYDKRTVFFLGAVAVSAICLVILLISLLVLIVRAIRVASVTYEFYDDRIVTRWGVFFKKYREDKFVGVYEVKSTPKKSAVPQIPKKKKDGTVKTEKYGNVFAKSPGSGYNWDLKFYGVKDYYELQNHLEKRKLQEKLTYTTQEK